MTNRRAHSFPYLATSVVTGSLLVVGAWLGFGQDPWIDHDHFAEFRSIPEKARSRPNPLENDSYAAVAGRKLFLQHCAECHGKTAEGGKKAPNLHAQEVQSATPGMLFWIMTNGVVRRGMPVWSKLPEPERWQIVSFLKSLPLSGGEPHDHTHDRF